MNPKIISLLAVSVLLAGGFGYAVSQKSIFLGVVLGVFWASLFVLRSFVVENWRISLAGIILEVGAMSFWIFRMLPGYLVLGISLLMAMFLFLGYQSGQGAVKNSFKIKFLSLGKPVIMQVATVLSLVITMVIMSSFNLDTPKLARQAFDKTIENAQMFLPIEIQEAPAVLRAQVYEQVFDATVGKLLHLPPEVQKGIVIGIWLLMFLSVRGVLVIADWLILAFGSLLFKILLSAQFFKITLESRDKEIISLES